MKSKKLLHKVFTPGSGSPVQFYWEIFCQASTPTSHTVLPSPYVQMIFPIKHAIAIECIDQPIFKPFLAQILESAKTIVLQPGAKIFGIHFNPAFVSKMYSVKAHELVRNANQLEDVVKPGYYNTMSSIVENEVSFNRRVMGLERYFRKIVPVTENIVSYSLNQFMNKDKILLKDIVKETRYSERWLQKKYHEVTGISPQEIQKIIRFNRFLKNIYLLKDQSLTQIALESGYFDQSHCIHQFKKLALVTPKKFFSERPEFNTVMNRL